MASHLKFAPNEKQNENENIKYLNNNLAIKTKKKLSECNKRCLIEASASLRDTIYLDCDEAFI
jgi:hypothetical protein